MIRGYLSGDWLILILIGLARSVNVARWACVKTREPPNLILNSIVLSSGLYVIMRFAGRTMPGRALRRLTELTNPCTASPSVRF